MDQYNCTAIFYVSSVDVAELLIKNGASVNHRNKDGLTPLHFIIRRNVNPKFLDAIGICLVNNGADINCQDNVSNQ